MKASVTAHRPFYSMGPTIGHLFDVRAGVPALASLEQASCLLEAVVQTLQDTAEEPNGAVNYGASYIAAMAKAVVDAVAVGLAQQQPEGV